MDGKLTRKIGNRIFINEKSNFVPIISIKSAYFSCDCKRQMTVNSEISKGIIYIYDFFPEKNKEQKLTLLYKDAENEKEFTKAIITLEQNIKIQNVVKELRKKKIDEILNRSDYNIEIIKPIKINEKEEEEIRKREIEENEKEQIKITINSNKQYNDNRQNNNISSEAKVIFEYECRKLTIQCTKNEQINSIFQKFSNKINKNINFLTFLYGGKNLNLNYNLTFNELANIIDKERNVMNVLVYDNYNNNYECICPKCGEKIELNMEKIDEIKSSVNNILNIVDGIKSSIENVIRISSNNSVNNQLTNVNLVISAINQDVLKINEKFNNLLNNDIFIINNYIIAEFTIKKEDVNRNIRILNCCDKNEYEIKKCEIRINEKLIPFNY